ncbi:MAG TPA: RNA polymerase subunit sigma-70, partial [Chitinophagaceae bacterium]
KYLSVIQHADMQQLEQMLHDEVTVISDGGGKAVAFRKPVRGREHVIRLLLGVYKKYYAHIPFKKTTINHEPALCYYENEKLATCMVLCVQQDHLINVYLIRNPDKLKALEKNLSKTVTF